MTETSSAASTTLSPPSSPSIVSVSDIGSPTGRATIPIIDTAEIPPITNNMADTANSLHITGPNSLPIEGQRGAPVKFRGRYDKVTPFIEHYERLCALKQVTSDKDKIKHCTQYCSRQVREFMEGLPSYKGSSWDDFKTDILNFFDAERDAGRYSVHDLEIFVKHVRLRKMKNLAAWKAYNRDFIRIAGWLTAHGKVTSEDKELYFWKGIHKEFRDRLEFRLQVMHPAHNQTTPWSIDKVTKVAELLLQRNKFDRDRLPTDSEDDSRDDYNDNTSEAYETSESEREDQVSWSRLNKLTQKMAKKSSKKKQTLASRPTKNSTAKSTDKASSHSPTREVEDLINRLNRMSIDDPDYAGLYFRACTLNPLVKVMLENIANQRRLNATTPPTRLRSDSSTKPQTTTTSPANPSQASRNTNSAAPKMRKIGRAHV